jgi:predicted kinase
MKREKMRKILFTRGVSGSGKSTVLNELNLTAFTISYDNLRLLYSNPIMEASGKITINQNVSPKVFELVYELLEKRMSRGETLVIDGTHAQQRDWQVLLNYANNYQYEIACLDFTKIDFEKIKIQNSLRPIYSIVPESVLMRQKENLEKSLPNNIKKIYIDDSKKYIEEVQNFLEPKLNNLDKYNRIIHIGDLQGCYTVFKEFERLMGSFKKDDFLIFIGDALDRGIENDKIMRWLIDNVPNNPNIVFLWGNHEDHINREAKNLSHVSNEFTENTLPQLKKANISRDELNNFISSVKDMFLYEYHGKKVLVTHGGLSNEPNKYWYLSTHLYSHGTGSYTDPVDDMWNKNVTDKNFFQIHGHRNSRHLETRIDRSFNLEGQVEFGGNLRTVILDKNEFKVVEVPNHVYKPLKERVMEEKKSKNKSSFDKNITPFWVLNSKEDDNKIPNEFYDKMISHKGVKARTTESYPHIVSLNFTRDVFYDKSWDDIVVKARGLFINQGTKEIVARGYDKFFNINERPETTLNGLEKILVFPVRGYLKENGYFGTIGYDRMNDSLFITSKSAPEGDFALNIRRIFNKKFTNTVQNNIKRFLKDTDSCMTFEVIDPIFDPHIVEYKEEDLILLDVMHRSYNYQKLEYKDLCSVAKQFNMNVKQQTVELKTMEAFKGFYNGVSKNSKKEIEGYVFEDISGFLFKAKLPFYNYWKWARTIKDSIVRGREKGKLFEIGDQKLNSRATELGCENMIDDMKNLIEWLNKQDDETLKKSVIDIRKLYLIEPKEELTTNLNMKGK